MSIEAMAWAKKVRVGDQSARLVLFVLADYADADGLTYPSFATLAHDCEVDRKTVIRAIKRLSDKGFLSIEPRKRGNGSASSNLYRLSLAAPQCAPSPAGRSTGGQASLPLTGGGDPAPGGWSQNGTRVVPQVSPPELPLIITSPSEIAPRARQSGTLATDMRGTGLDPAVKADNAAWGRALRLLTDQGGLSDTRARRFFGRLLARNGVRASDLGDAMAAAEANGTADPQSWLARAAKGLADARGSAAPTPTPDTWDAARWSIALEVAAEKGGWPAAWGARPGSPDCLLPESLNDKARALGLTGDRS